MKIRILVPKEDYEDLLKNTTSFGAEFMVGCCQEISSSILLNNFKSCNFSSSVEINIHEFLNKYKKLNKLFKFCDSFISNPKICFWAEIRKKKVKIKGDISICINSCDKKFIQEIHNILKEFGWAYIIDPETKDYEINKTEQKKEFLIVLDNEQIKCLSNISKYVINPRKYDTIEIKTVPKFSLFT